MDDGDSRRSPAESTHEPAPETEPAARIVVDIVVDDGDWSAFAHVENAIIAAVAAVSEAGELAIEPAEAAIVLSSDASVRELNRTYRRQDKSTNVLSFPAPELPAGVVAGRKMLGDVVLAAETVSSEAQAHAIPPVHHLQHLVVHGLLHLLGYDHLTDAQAAEMETLETRILARIGVADPYAEPAL